MVIVTASPKPPGGFAMKKSREQAAQDNRAIQLNAEHPTYHRARGLGPKAAEQAARAVHRQNQSGTSSLESSPRPFTKARSPR